MWGGMSEHEKFTKELLYIMPELFREFSLGKYYFLSNILGHILCERYIVN